MTTNIFKPPPKKAAFVLFLSIVMIEKRKKTIKNSIYILLK